MIPFNKTEDLITVQEFARKYRVDESVVRRWVKMGHIDYVLVGVGRQMKRIRQTDLVKPLLQEGMNGNKAEEVTQGTTTEEIQAGAAAPEPAREPSNTQPNRGQKARAR